MLVLGVGVCLIVGFGLAALALPAWDDFSRAVWNQQYTFTQYIFGFNYFHHGGRWAGYGFSAWVLTAVDLYGAYPWLVAGIFCAEIAAFDALLGAIFREGMGRGRRLAGALAAWAVFWASAPDPAASLYWFTGAVEYHLGFSLFVIAMACAWRSAGARGRMPGWIVAVTAAAVFVLAAVHELLGLSICVVLAGLCAAGYVEQWPARRGLAVLTGAAAAGCASMVAAPGNYVRAERIEAQAGAAEKLRIVLKYLDAEVVGALFSPQLIAGAVVLGLVAWGWRREGLCRVRLSAKGLAVLAAANLAIVAAWVAIPALVIHETPPGRVTNGLFHIWMVSVMLWVPVAAVKAGGMEGAAERLRPWRAGAMAVLGGLLLLGGNTLLGVNDLMRRGPRWHEEAIGRKEVLEDVRHLGTRWVRLEALRVYPMLLPHGEVTKDPEHWINRAYGDYFGYQDIAVEEHETMDGFRELD